MALTTKQNPKILGLLRMKLLTPAGYFEEFFARKYDHTTDQWMNVEISDETYPNRWEEVPMFVNEIELQELKRSLKKSNNPLEFDCDYILTPIQDHPKKHFLDS